MPDYEDARADAISEVDGSSLFSDGESDIDSPADGYFTQRQHPQQFFTRNEPSDSKAQEANRPTDTYAERTSYLPSSSQHPIWATEQTPLLDAGPAPPDYYAATADRRRNGQSADYGVPSYGSIEDEEEEFVPRETPRILLQAGLFGSIRAPQSMSNLPREETLDEEDPTRHKQTRRTLRSCVRSRWSRKCVVSGFVLLVTLTIVLVCVLGSRDDSAITIPVKPQPESPTKTPSPTTPDDNPHMPHDGAPTPSSQPGCGYSIFSDSWHYDFDKIKDFSFIERYNTHVNKYNLGGSIWIRRAPAEQKPDIRVTINYVTSADVRIVDPKPSLGRDSITISMPDVDLTGDYSGRRPCIDAGIAIDVKQGLQLNDWLLRASVFNIFTANRLFNSSDTEVFEPMSVKGTTTFSTLAGKIDCTYWDSRETIIDSTSGTVHGWFGLNDLLQITTTSGQVIVAVEPLDEDPERPVPATLKIKSQSGSIKGDFPIEELKDRDYNTFIETKSGSITGSYIHGSLTTLQSTSGTIVTDVIPVVLNDKNRTSLYTKNISGATSITMATPHHGRNLTNLHSVHDSSTGSGSILMRYPDQWAGSLTGTSQTGTLIVRGRGVKVDWYSDFGWIAGKKIAGSKGNGQSLLEFRTRSGAADLGIGNDLRIGS